MRHKPRPKLYLRFKTPDGRQSPYCPAVFDGKSRLKPFWCLVKGVLEHHPEGVYYRRLKRDGKWTWASLGRDPRTAESKSLAEAKVREPEFIPIPGICEAKPQPPPVAANSGFRLDEEVREYLTNAAKLAAKTYKAYKKSLELFQESCRKTYVHQIGKQDLQSFDTFLLQRGNDDRTRSNRVGHIVTFLRNEQGRRPGPPSTGVSITIKYVESPPEAYTRQELEDLFRVSDEDERFLWRLFLGTGFRESETSVAESTDVNHDTKLIRVDEKPEFGFRPKDCEKRYVPISDALIAEIGARAKSGSCSLLFDNNGRPDGHLLRRLKRVAFDGGLNCGKCKGKELLPVDFEIASDVELYDPCRPIRERVSQAEQELSTIEDAVRCLVLYSRCTPWPIFDWRIIVGVMRERGQGVQERHEQVSPADQLANFRPGILDAVIVLDQLRTGYLRFRAHIAAQESKAKRMLTDTEYLSELQRARGTERDMVLSRLRVIVHENPNSQNRLPREIFRGPSDEWYSVREDGQIGRTFVGEEIQRLEKEGVYRPSCA